MDIVRDPLWNNIRLDRLALALVDTGAMQRLRYVRQLGLAHLVYPGATHTRFEHALGTYHLARLTLGILHDRGDLRALPTDEASVVLAAALLHDIGHYPFAHALEEIGAPHHEDVGRALITSGDIARILSERIAADAPGRVAALVRAQSESPLQGLVSGSLDLDKIEYLKRDAHMCGVPYGEIDVDRLINSLALVRIGEDGASRVVVGITEKGLSALESLLFAKYQMYRNVYWHHAVRSATAMYKRAVGDALASGALEVNRLPSFTDDQLLQHLADVAPSEMLTRLKQRRLYKRAFECPAAELPDDAGEWIASDPARTAAAERALASELGLADGEVLLDYPEKTQMLDLDLPVQLRSGAVSRLTSEGLPGVIHLPELSAQLYKSARWLRIFTARPAKISKQRVLQLVSW
ncbi:MAG TPA: HD domain-containing protein [Gemmatimonadaceae bacterium]